jgi:hypothetical protein
MALEAEMFYILVWDATENNSYESQVVKSEAEVKMAIQNNKVSEQSDWIFYVSTESTVTMNWKEFL